jgi:hypothetical protein
MKIAQIISTLGIDDRAVLQRSDEIHTMIVIPSKEPTTTEAVVVPMHNRERQVPILSHQLREWCGIDSYCRGPPFIGSE